MNTLKKWMQQATAAEKKQLAELAETTAGTLAQIAGGYRTDGEARVEPALAARLEHASKTLKRTGLTPLKRTDLSPVCAACSFARRYL